MTELFPFRYFDPLRRRWVHAAYKASRETIEKLYEKWEITGPAELREPDAGGHGCLARSPPDRGRQVGENGASAGQNATGSDVPRGT